MIKKCRVILNNDAVTVVDFDGVEVQLPSIKKEARYVNILHDNDNYSIVSDDEINKETTDNASTVKSKKSSRSKKKVSEDNEEIDSN